MSLENIKEEADLNAEVSRSYERFHLMLKQLKREVIDKAELEFIDYFERNGFCCKPQRSLGAIDAIYRDFKIELRLPRHDEFNPHSFLKFKISNNNAATHLILASSSVKDIAGSGGATPFSLDQPVNGMKIADRINKARETLRWIRLSIENLATFEVNYVVYPNGMASRAVEDASYGSFTEAMRALIDK
jgi:hypothetical protein